MDSLFSNASDQLWMKIREKQHAISPKIVLQHSVYPRPTVVLPKIPQHFGIFQ
eukprot:c20401_g1_i1 orf=160-318(+)